MQKSTFFASPKLFNDPFDCRIGPNLSLLDTRGKIKDFALKVMTEQNLPVDKNQIEKFCIRILNNRNNEQENYNAMMFEGKASHYGVLSLSTRWDSILMWSHYADNHEGYSVGF